MSAYQGYCTAQLIEAWLDNFLLPQVQPGQVIVMDNAPFHNSIKIRELIEKAKTWRLGFAVPPKFLRSWV
ncbi:MAG: transposase [Microcoleaceae cyanobacterium]